VIASIADEDDKLLIINNGAYGERMCQIAKTYGINFTEYKSSWTDPIDMKLLDEVMAKSCYSYLLAVHSETTTGMLNNITELGVACKKHGVELVIDAMSSFAAIEIDMAPMNIHYLIASSNKNLQGMAGVGFVVINKNSLETIRSKKAKSFYLDLYAQYEHFVKTKQTRFTPPVQTLYALKQAIEETKKETVRCRGLRYRENWNTLLDGLEGLGLSYLIDRKYHSGIITSVLEPESPCYNFDEMHDYLKDRGFTIYPGKIGAMNTFRIANIGAINQNDIKKFLICLKDYLRNL
jgi:2-aminoethylphosphonate-pyruvate transaminase